MEAGDLLVAEDESGCMPQRLGECEDPWITSACCRRQGGGRRPRRVVVNAAEDYLRNRACREIRRCLKPAPDCCRSIASRVRRDGTRPAPWCVTQAGFDAQRCHVKSFRGREISEPAVFCDGQRPRRRLR